MNIDPPAAENLEPAEARATVPEVAVTQPAARALAVSVSRAATITVPRTTSIIIASVSALILLSGGFAAGAAMAGRGPAPTLGSAAPTVTVTAEPAEELLPSIAPTPAPTPTNAPTPTGVGIGTPVNVGAVTLTVNSLEVVNHIDVVSGDPLVPVAGGALVLFRTSYMNTQNAADLSCGGTDLFIQVFDEKDREMAPIFETSRIPGNQGCNDHLLQGTTADWNWAVQGVAGAVPTRMEVTDSIMFGNPTVIHLR